MKQKKRRETGNVENKKKTTFFSHMKKMPYWEKTKKSEKRKKNFNKSKNKGQGY